MKRYYFFAVLFPPLFMNTLLVSARPLDLPRYFLAGYFVAVAPALAAAFVDAILEHKRAAMRAGSSALCAMVTMPALFAAFEAATAWQAVQLSACAALAGFICTMGYIQLTALFPKLREKPFPAARA